MKLLLVLLFLFTSCTKFGKNITIEGRVFNPITGEGIEGAKLKLLKSKVFALSGGYKEITEAITNSNGEFEVNKFRLRAEVLRAQDLNGDYYAIGWTSDNGQSFITQNASDLIVTKGKKQKADFWAVPYGCLKWHIKNNNCEGSTDTMWYKIKYQYQDEFLDLWSTPIVGCADIVGAGCDKMPVGNHYLYVKLSRPSGTVYYYDTVFVSDASVTNFDFFY